MRFAEFMDSPDTSGKLYLCSGNENYFHDRIKNLFVQKFPNLKIQNVEADDEPENFYPGIEADSLFSEPKLIFINNVTGELKDKKLFEQYVKSAATAKYFVFGDDLKTSLPNIKIDCAKVKDSPKDVYPYLKQILFESGVNFSLSGMSIFYQMYRNDIQTIYNEIQKIKLFNTKEQKILLERADVLNILSPSEHVDIFDFSNNFMNRKLRGALNSLPADDFLPHIGNIFSTSEKLFIAKKSKLPDEQIIKNYKFNSYYFLHTIKPLLGLWSEGELKNLIGEMNSIRLKLKETKIPIRLALKNSVLKYCTR
jgi:DNA polymerase III delta subunit